MYSVVLVLSLLILRTSAYPTGDVPPEACNTGPQHGGNTGNSAEGSNYHISVLNSLGEPAEQFQSGETLTVRIEGRDDAVFNGYLLWAVPHPSNGSGYCPLGQWTGGERQNLRACYAIQGSSGGANTPACSDITDNAIAHSERLDTNSIEALFKVPDSLTTDIIFSAHIVMNFDTFWLNIESKPVSLKSNDNGDTTTAGEKKVSTTENGSTASKNVSLSITTQKAEQTTSSSNQISAKNSTQASETTGNSTTGTDNSSSPSTTQSTASKQNITTVKSVENATTTIQKEMDLTTPVTIGNKTSSQAESNGNETTTDKTTTVPPEVTVSNETILVILPKPTLVENNGTFTNITEILKNATDVIGKSTEVSVIAVQLNTTETTTDMQTSTTDSITTSEEINSTEEVTATTTDMMNITTTQSDITVTNALTTEQTDNATDNVTSGNLTETTADVMNTTESINSTMTDSTMVVTVTEVLNITTDDMNMTTSSVSDATLLNVTSDGSEDTINTTTQAIKATDLTSKSSEPTTTEVMIETTGVAGEKTSEKTIVDLTTSEATNPDITTEEKLQVTDLTTPSEETADTTTIIPKDSKGANFHTVNFKLDGDFDKLVGSDPQAAEDEVKDQLARIMKIDKSRIHELKLTKGSVEVTAVIEADENGEGITMEEANALLEKHLMNGGSIVINGEKLRLIKGTLNTEAITDDHGHDHSGEEEGVSVTTKIVLGVVFGLIALAIIIVVIIMVMKQRKHHGFLMMRAMRKEQKEDIPMRNMEAGHVRNGQNGHQNQAFSH